MPEGSQHRTLPSGEAVKLEAVARLLRQALRLAEGAEASGRPDVEPPQGQAASPPASAPAAPSTPAPAPSSGGEGSSSSASGAPRSPTTPAAGGGGGGGGPAQVGYLLGLLQTEQARIEETKKEVARKDTELTLKLQFAKKKDEDLEAREGELKKLDAQLRIREMQITRREERMREMGRMGPASDKES